MWFTRIKHCNFRRLISVFLSHHKSFCLYKIHRDIAKVHKIISTINNYNNLFFPWEGFILGFSWPDQGVRTEDITTVQLVKNITLTLNNHLLKTDTWSLVLPKLSKAWSHNVKLTFSDHVDSLSPKLTLTHSTSENQHFSFSSSLLLSSLYPPSLPLLMALLYQLVVAPDGLGLETSISFTLVSMAEWL